MKTISSFTKKMQLFATLILVGLTSNVFSQTTVINFETANDGYSANGVFATGYLTDVFNRVEANIGGNSSWIWAAEDLDVAGKSIIINTINVAGANTFTFSIDLLAAHYESWDITDKMTITYSLDGGAYQNLMWIRSIKDSDDYNSLAAIDTDFDGNGECSSVLPSFVYGSNTYLGCSADGELFKTYTTPSITLSSNSTLNIKIEFENLTSNTEGIYIDNIVVSLDGEGGTTTGTSCDGVINCVDGNVGIGTANPVSKLAVNGTITTKEVNVTIDPASWPDFVFTPEYKLESLKNISEYISKNNHLPGVPSENEIYNNGVNLGEMNTILLQKIEELTLHIIELENRISELEK